MTGGDSLMGQRYRGLQVVKRGFSTTERSSPFQTEEVRCCAYRISGAYAQSRRCTSPS